MDANISTFTRMHYKTPILKGIVPVLYAHWFLELISVHCSASPCKPISLIHISLSRHVWAVSRSACRGSEHWVLGPPPFPLVHPSLTNRVISNSVCPAPFLLTLADDQRWKMNSQTTGILWRLWQRERRTTFPECHTSVISIHWNLTRAFFSS